MSGPHPIVQLANRALARDDTGKVVLDEQGTVTYTQLVPEIAQEPDYEAAIAALG